MWADAIWQWYRRRQVPAAFQGKKGFLMLVLRSVWSADECCEFADSSGADRCLLGSKWLLNNGEGRKRKRGLFFSLYPTWIAVGDMKMSEKETPLFFLRPGNGITTENMPMGWHYSSFFGGQAMTIHLLTCLHRKRNSDCLFVDQVVCKLLLPIPPFILFSFRRMWLKQKSVF